MLLFNAVVGKGLTNKGAFELGPKGRQEGSWTYYEIADRGVLGWGAPDVQEAARGRIAKGGEQRAPYHTGPASHCKDLPFDFERDGAGVGGARVSRGEQGG